MIALSVVIISFNEEKNIGRCLQSVQGIADEIVVLDSFSKDNTPEICKKFKVKFHQHAFDGHIQQKNRALTFASNDYVLSLDADEALSEELKKSILHVKNNWTHDGYYFNRLTNFCGKWIKHCGWYPDQKLRLWNKQKGKWEGQNPHDKFVLQAGSTQKHLTGDLLHYSYYTIAQHMVQVNKFSGIHAKEAFEKKKKFSYLKLIISPAIKFIKHYFLKAGLLDGFYGLVISFNSAHYNFLKYAKLKELYINKNKNEHQQQ